jgi:hypothetical protein
MLNISNKLVIATSLALSIGILSITSAAAKEKKSAVFEDELNSGGGVAWGGPSLPYRKAVDIKDSLVETPVGKIAADRHGMGSSMGSLLFGPYSFPDPGRMVFISLWGSKIEGCFAEMIVQIAPPNGIDFDVKALIPTKLELGVGGQQIELTPQSSTAPVIQDHPYTHTVTRNGQSVEIPATWYMTRNLFAIDAEIANILRSASVKESRMRLSLSNGEKLLIPIRKETVEAWKTAYSFNPTCQNPEVAAKKQAFKASKNPLPLAFENYSGSTQQEDALKWLQTKLSAKQLQDFAKLWRGGKTGALIQLTDAGKYYKGTPQQENALKWLQRSIPNQVMDEFLQQWI